MESGDVLLVGSVPFDAVSEVFSTCSQILGEHAYALPDGEIGERSAWIMSLPRLCYAKNTDLEPIHVVQGKVESPSSHDPKEMKATFGTFKFKPGVKNTIFDLPYAKEAISSYSVFSKLRSEGKLPKQLRFQISLPCTHDATSSFFPVAADRPLAARAYEASLQKAIEEILEHVPAKDLVIQLDYCTELLAIIGSRDSNGFSEERFQRYTSREYLSPLTKYITEEVLLGYHLCYGTWGGWPMSEVKDMGFCVRLANAIVANTPRRVDFLHLPVLRNTTDAFFAPLTNLAIGQTKIFLGLELADGVEAMVERATIARRYLPQFGVSHYCGYGRESPEKVRILLKDLRLGAEQIS